MKIYEKQLEYLIGACERTARMRGFSDMLRLPLEWRPAPGLELLYEYVNDRAMPAPDTHTATMTSFINAYAAYMDEENNIKYSAIGMTARKKLGR